jgi:hypothetical protein
MIVRVRKCVKIPTLLSLRGGRGRLLLMTVPVNDIPCVIICV